MPEEEEQLLEDSSWIPADLQAVLDGDAPATVPEVLRRSDGKPLLYPGRINGLQGESESAKSWAAQIAAHQEIELGRHVWYVDYEDSVDGLVERMLSLGTAPEALVKCLHYISPETGFNTDRSAVTVTTELYMEHGLPSLVVIDGVTEAMALDLLSPDIGTDVAKFHRGLPRLAALSGSTVVLIDHVTKSKEGRGRYAIGSERKLSGITGVALSFTAKTPFGRGRTGRVDVEVAKDRAGYVRGIASDKKVAELELVSTPDGSGGFTTSYTLSPPLSTVGPTGEWQPQLVMEKVSKLLEDTGGMTHNNLMAAKGSTKKQYWDQAIEDLIEEGYVKVEDGPRNAKIHTLVKPYRIERP